MTTSRQQPLSVRGLTAIVGIADDASPTGELPDFGVALEMRIVAEALADAGIHPTEVDGLAVAGGAMSPLMYAERLGIHPRWVDSTHVGGSSFEVHVQHAALALAAGMCDVAVVVYANTPKGDRRRHGTLRGDASVYGPEHFAFEAPTGILQPMTAYALAAQRHMSLYGTRPEDLAQIAVTTREYATHNPKARQQQPLTVEEVVATPTICGPLRSLDCCLITDGAGAIVMTRADRARDTASPAAYVLGAATANSHLLVSGMPELTVSPGAVSGPDAFAQAGITAADVDVLETYDSFTITVLLALEDLGFCPKGEGGAFVRSLALRPDGAIPTNTSGGGLSYTHPGMFGMFLLVEAVRQLRGESRGVAIPDVDIAVAHGCGGLLSSTGTVVLGTEETL
jgi:acetyl-CoA acetyltransferase